MLQCQHGAVVRTTAALGQVGLVRRDATHHEKLQWFDDRHRCADELHVYDGHDDEYHDSERAFDNESVHGLDTDAHGHSSHGVSSYTGHRHGLSSLLVPTRATATIATTTTNARTSLVPPPATATTTANSTSVQEA